MKRDYIVIMSKNLIVFVFKLNACGFSLTGVAINIFDQNIYEVEIKELAIKPNKIVGVEICMEAVGSTNGS